MMGYQLKFNPIINKVKNLVKQNYIGKINNTNSQIATIISKTDLILRSIDPDWVFERFCEETDYKNPSPIRKTKSNSKENFKFQKSPSIKSDSLLNNPLHNSSEPYARFKIRSMVSLLGC